MMEAIGAGNCKIRIVTHREAQLLQRVSVAATAGTIERRESFLPISQDNPCGGGGGLRRRRLCVRRRAQELAMCGVTEIEITMPASSGDKKRSRRNSLRLQGF